MQILLGTKNKHKIIELTAIINELSPKLEIKTLNDFIDINEPVEDGNSYEENAFIKAKYYFDHFHIPVVADDSGLEVKCLNDKPGIYSARFAKIYGQEVSDENNRKILLQLLKEYRGNKKRSATFVCAILFYDGQNTFTTRGLTHGYITKEEKGTGGFGYDPIFYSDELKKTLAEATEEEKNMISHRGKALRKMLKEHLSNL